MGEVTSSRVGLTRRSFLKTAGAAGALGLAGAAGMTSSSNWLAPVEANADEGAEERVAYTYHQKHCRGNCMLKCTVRDGRLCKIEPNMAAAKGFQSVCLKGLSEIQHVYSADRIQSPMKRVGERGSGEFVAISWDEALDIFSENVKSCWDKYGKSSVYLAAATESEISNMRNIMQCGYTSYHGIDIGISNGLAPMFGFKAASAVNDIRDWKNCKTFIAISLNFIETSLTHSRHYFNAMEAGMHTIVIDPHYSSMASKSDEWIPIEPGTDGAFYLGMASSIIDNEWYDKAFMRDHTTFPFLVSTVDGTMLESPEGDFMVWDPTTSAPKSYTETNDQTPLEGEFDYEGVTYATAFTLFKEGQKTQSVEWAADVTKIPASEIERIAKMYALDTPSVLAIGQGGCDKYNNSDIAGHAAGILAALTGNIGKSGTGLGYPGNGGYASATLPSWPLKPEMKTSSFKTPVYELPYVENDIRCYITLGDQIMQHFADLNKVYEWLMTLDFVCYIDIHAISGSQYADLILPISSRFESETEIGGVQAVRDHIMLREKVIEPLFESKSEYELERMLMDSLGLGDVMHKTTEELVSYQLANIKSPLVDQVTIESLQANQGVMTVKNADTPYCPMKSLKFPSPTGRLEVYYDKYLKFNQALPVFEYPEETAPDSDVRAKYPLQYAQSRTRFHIHDQFCDSTWIQELYKTCVEMNPVDMKSRGLSDKDDIVVYNDRGEFSCPVRSNESIRPGSIRIMEGEWTKFMKSGNYQNVTNPTIIPRGRVMEYGPVIPYNDTLVEVKKA